MTNFNYKSIADPIHGAMGFSRCEVEVINSAVFQRLRNVKHLGFAHYVFPGADFSRFSHSLGVCHLTGRILDALCSNGEAISDEEKQYFRLAGLLHDIGHYPFSHACEEAIKDHYRYYELTEDSGSTAVNETSETELAEKVKTVFEHERLGKLILEKDRELKNIFATHDIESLKISQIFMREKVPKYSNLISSDLDADRIDYLMRVAHHTGLPYGNIDLDYLLTQIAVDKNHFICMSRKALRAVDHFLLSRYFQYQQVVYNKTVLIFEALLKDVISDLLKAGNKDWSRKGITSMVKNEEWKDFDDTSVYQMIRDFSKSTNDPVSALRAQALLQREPPFLAGRMEYLGSRAENDDARKLFKELGKSARSKNSKWSEKFNIDSSQIYVISKDSSITKMGSHISTSEARALTEEGGEDDLAQVARIMTGKDRQSTPITEIKGSLMSQLADSAMYFMGVYFLLPPNEQDKRKEIEKIVQSDLSFLE